MPGTDEELRNALLKTFRDEADEILAAITDDLIALEQGGGVIDPAVSESIYRRTHSLKGAARSACCMALGDVAEKLQEQARELQSCADIVNDIEYQFERVAAEVARLQKTFSA